MKKQAVYVGTPELGASDLEGTLFLLRQTQPAATLRTARTAQRRDELDAARSAARVKRRGVGLDRLEASGVSPLDRLVLREELALLLSAATESERRLLALLGLGHTMAAVADLLGVATGTIYRHAHNLRQKLMQIRGVA